MPKLKAQKYITSPSFTNSEITTLAALRSHTTRGIKGNFSSWFKQDLSCPLSKQCKSEDTQQHLLLCQVILEELTPQEKSEHKNISYQDIYGSLEQQMTAVKLFSSLLDIRERLLQAAHPASGSTLDATPLLGRDGRP